MSEYSGGVKAALSGHSNLEEYKMLERFKRHLTRYTILVFMLVITVLTGCKNDAYIELSETVKRKNMMRLKRRSLKS